MGNVSNTAGDCIAPDFYKCDGRCNKYPYSNKTRAEIKNLGDFYRRHSKKGD